MPKFWFSLCVCSALFCSPLAFAATDFQLDLGGQRFDPLNSSPILPPAWQQQSAGPAFRLVQFKGPIQPQWLTALRHQGMTPVQYIHPYSYVVWGDLAAAQRIATLAEVRWSGDFLPAYKVQPTQRHLGRALQPTMLLLSRQADRAALGTLLADSGAQVELQRPLDAHLELMQLSVSGDAYLALASFPGIYAIQSIPQDAGLRGESSNQSIVGNYGPPPSNTIFPGYADWLDATGFDGSGVTVGIVDGGVRTTHLDLASRMLPCVSAGQSRTSCSSSNNSHGTHVAGAVAGTGATGSVLNGFLRGQGVAPGANLIQQRYGTFLGGGPGGMVADGMLTISKESALSGAQLSNNSWGPTGSPQGYDIPTQQVDMISRDANPDEPGAQPVLAVWSIMNGNGDSGGACAPSSLGSPDEAKNLFAVGSTKLLSGGNQLAAIFDISSNSGHGNACDGRRVPHIVAPGCSTDSTTSSSNTAHSSTSCGTSMASPVVSGAVALFIQKYRSLFAGSTPSPALIKAAFTAVAQNLEGFRDADNRVMGHRPDRFQGYGRIDLEAVMNPPQPVVYVEQDSLLTASGQSWTASYSAADPDQPIRIMLAWTDAKGHGLGGSTPAWVNDLDLRVSADGEDYLGNVVGADGWSATGGAADERNNLEGVFLRADQHAGAVTITVDASNIAADALDPFEPGDPAQDFALVCYNCLGEAVVGAADLGLQLSASPNPVTAGAQLVLSAQIANGGPDAAVGARLQLELLGAIAFVSAQAVEGGPSWSCTAQRQFVECLSSGSLPVESNASTLELLTEVSALAGTGPLSIAGEVAASQYSDIDPGNNVQTVLIDVFGDDMFADGFE